MKTISTTVPALLLCLVIGYSQAQEHGNQSGFRWQFKGGYPNGDAVYTFDVPMGKRDRWNSDEQDAPPLSPGAAIRRAKGFMEEVQLPKATETWRLIMVKLLPIADAEGKEQWLYVISFNAVEANTIRTGGPDMKVPVRMDGTIPKPIIQRRKS